MEQQRPTAIHLVGSLPFDSTTEAMRTCASILGTSLRRLPDGEIGNGRSHYVGSQMGSLPPGVMPQYAYDFSKMHNRNVTPDEGQLSCGPTHYDEWAIKSYADFRKLREEGVIQSGVRFQVGVPSVASVLLPLVKLEWRARVEKEYETVLFDALRNIQERIPHEDLAIQIDCGSDLSFVDGFKGWPGMLDYTTWFPEPHFEGIVDRLAKIGGVVAPDVVLGYHLCYGDIHGKHLVEPADLSSAVRVTGAIQERLSRKVDYVQMPVPTGRSDDEYFAPLRRLDTSIELVLGLWHPDAKSTREKLEAASRTGLAFSISSECGLGRHSREETEIFLKTAPQLVAPE